MRAWTGIALALALGVAGCQSNRSEPATSGGGGGPTIAPSPLKAPPHPQLRSGPTGGVGRRAGGDMGGMDASGIGPGSTAGGPGPRAGTNSNVAPRNAPSRIKR